MCSLPENDKRDLSQTEASGDETDQTEKKNLDFQI